MADMDGLDVTAHVDLTSDLGDDGLVGNNGQSQAPAGTRVAGTDGAVPQNTQPPKSSVREALTAAFQNDAGQATGQQDTNTAVNGERQRDAQGRFIPTAAEQAAAAAQQQQNGAQATVQPPAWLPLAEAQQFVQLPAEMQQFVARTMEGIEQTAARYRGYDGLEQLIAPRREAWGLNGMTEHQAIHQLFTLSDFASRDPAQFVQWFAQQQGIDLRGLSQQAPTVDPQVQALQQQLGHLQNVVQQQTQGQQQQAHNALVNEVATFGAETGQDGNVLRPYFEELGTAILPFIQAVRAENPNRPVKELLADAYDRACWGIPAVRAKMLAAQEAQNLTRQREAATRARTAGSSVQGGPLNGTSVPNTPGSGSVRDILQQQFAALH